MDQRAFMGNACGDDHSGNNKLKSTSWNHNNKTTNNEKLENMMKSWEYPYGYPWPPRYYKCSFCSREFKSSQALGGHMNVHRRERAKLRSDQSPLSPSNPNPNSTNPSFSSSSSLATTSIYTHQYSLVSLSLSSLSSLSSSSYLGHGVNPYSMASTHDKNLGLGRSFKDKSSDRDEDKEDEGVKLDLELGLISDTKEVVHDLDLELRLGIGLQKPS